MNKTSNTYRFTALTMALLMFFTSLGFAINVHYCQGELKSFSFWSKAKTCNEMIEEAVPMKNCSHQKKEIAEKDGCTEGENCCSSKTVHFQFDQEQQIRIFDSVSSQLSGQFMVAYIAVFFTNDFYVKGSTASYTHYKPPLIFRDIPVLIQSFLF